MLSMEVGAACEAGLAGGKCVENSGPGTTKKEKVIFTFQAKDDFVTSLKHANFRINLVQLPRPPHD